VANAVEARWHGDDYQARFFWIQAARLRDPENRNVIEVTYEGDGPKSFDDVIVRYDPPRRSLGPRRISADYHQIKWHVTGEGRFGFADLVDPDFIHATSISLLQRLADAKAKAPPDAAFTLVTTDRIRDGDPLDELVSKTDGSLRLSRLAKGKGPTSRMGKVRKLWREHLGLADDAALYDLLGSFYIREGNASLEALREEVNLRFRVVGLVCCEHSMEFRFDAAARALKVKGINRLDRDSFEILCREEEWIRPSPEPTRQSIAIRAFGGVTPADLLDAPDDHSLSLLDLFEGRHLGAGRDWERDVRPPVTAFLGQVLSRHSRLRLFLDAHATIAFLAGSLLGPKSGASVEVVQKGLRSTIAWHAEDGRDGPPPDISTETIGAGKNIVLAIGLTHDAAADARAYAAANLPGAGTLIRVLPDGGTGPLSVQGGAHAARIAAAAAATVVQHRTPGAAVHVFVAGPNAFSFMLGQQAERMGQCVAYEFDFGARRDGSYHPTFRI
jgi:hypothetical protein